VQIRPDFSQILSSGTPGTHSPPTG